MNLLPKNRKLRLPFILAIFVIVLVGGFVVANWVVRPRFMVWREQRENKQAREFFNKGDINNAFLSVRKAYTRNPQNADAWQLAVEISEKQNVQDVVIYQQHLAEVVPTLDNKLKLLRLAIKWGAVKIAEETIPKIGAEGAKSAEFLELAAQMARRTGNPTKAKYYLMSLLSLQPNNMAAKYELAQIRLLGGISDNKDAVRSEILSIANDPEYRVRAYTLLLADAIESKNANDALNYADKLAAMPDAPPPTQIYVAEAYRRHSPTKFDGYIKRLEEAYQNDQAKVIILVNYLSANGQAAESRRWVESLTEKIRTVEGVQLNYAFTLLLLKDWPALDDFLRGVKWKDNEFARHAILAYRQRANGNENGFNDEWRLAMIDAGNNQRKLQTLQAQVSTWNWEDQKFELVWKRFMLDPSKPEYRQALTSYEKEKGHTANLNRLFARLLELDPKDNDAKNNFAYTSMLLGVNLDRAYQLAEEVYNSSAKTSHDFYAGTYSLALYKQGKAAEALTVLQGNNLTDLYQSSRPLLLALYLTANGKVEDGLTLAKHVDMSKFLPEERALMNDINALAEKNQRQQKSADLLTALSSGNSAANEKKSWLATLPAQYRKSTPVNVELADSLYARDDYKGLENAVRNDTWATNDFLRFALLAFAQRSQGNEIGAKDAWQSATLAAGSRMEDLQTLANIAERWGWQPERIVILTRIFERSPNDQKSFNDLVEYYTRNGSTPELAHIYDIWIESSPSDADAKSRFAYYSLLVGTNLSRAHVMAKQAFDAAPDNIFRAKVYAFSLLKQMRPTDADRVLGKLTGEDDGGQAQLGLLRAALAAQHNNQQQVRTNLDAFKPTGALPEEKALADSLAKSLAKEA